MLAETTIRQPSQLRRDARLANLNAGLWAVGNGLAPTILVVFYAIDLKAQGLLISWVLAAPRFAGLLRLFVPTAINRLGSRKRLCVSAYIASGIVLAMLPLVASPGILQQRNHRLVALVVCWALYQVLEYFGTTALWSWLGDLYPARLRGRLVGQRERWLVNGRIAGMAIGFAATVAWSAMMPKETPRWPALAGLIVLGGLLMAMATWPLLRMMSLPLSRARRQTPWQAMLRAMSDKRFAGLMAWSVGLSIANGISAAARATFQRVVLGFEYQHVLPLVAGMRAGQSILAPTAGRWVDRLGCRPVMFWSQAIAATSPLFFLFATPETRWLIAGAFVVWIAFGALNVSLDSMKLAVAPINDNAPALAIYYAAADLSSGVTILLGGIWLGHIFEVGKELPGNYAAVLLTGFALRALMALLVPTLSDERRPRAML